MSLLPLYETVMGEGGGPSSRPFPESASRTGRGSPARLLVGLSFAKGARLREQRPLAGIHHIEGHILANALEGPLDLPALVLVVSGGHTQLVAMERVGRYEVVGSTRDDAAGEAFDKIGKLLGLPFPGGPAIERAALAGNRAAFDFPRGLRRSGGFDFSFSGLKTAVRLKAESFPALTPEIVADVAASAQEAIVDVLVGKSLVAARERRARRLCLAGGVAATAASASSCGSDSPATG